MAKTQQNSTQLQNKMEQQKQSFIQYEQQSELYIL